MSIHRFNTTAGSNVVGGPDPVDGIEMMLLRLLMNGTMHPTQMARLLDITDDEVRQRMRRLQKLGVVEYLSPDANA